MHAATPPPEAHRGSAKPSLTVDLRHQILDAALNLGRRLSYSNLGTVEFLVSLGNEQTPFAFIEVNPDCRSNTR